MDANMRRRTVLLGSAALLVPAQVYTGSVWVKKPGVGWTREELRVLSGRHRKFLP